MKIGLISDIHSHLAPLQKALALLDQHGVDQIVCAGDLIGEGYEGDAVVRLLQEREILSVLGNHDEEVFGDQARIRREMRKYSTPNHLLLDSWTTAHVSSLPLTRTFVWEGLSVCLAHGTPLSNKDYLFPCPHLPTVPDLPRTSGFKYFEIQRVMHPLDIYILGHTHIPMLTIFNRAWFVNPGSVSRNRTDDGRTCAILTLPDRHLEVLNIETGEPIVFDRGSWETM
jgi:putative phosphoesterase